MNARYAFGMAVVAGVLVWVPIGCGSGDGQSITVYAAASLTEAFEDLVDEYEQANPDVDVRLSFAGSARLAAQIEAGAGADVFASADGANMARVVDAGRAHGQPEVFARNHLALVTPAGNPGRVLTLADLADDSLVVAVCAPEVPCGSLARAVLTQSGVTVDADTEETSVRAVLTKVTLGEADAGLVYATDVAAGGDRVEEVPIDHFGLATDYPIVTLNNRPETAAFTEFVTGPKGRNVLARHGFELP